MARIKVTTNCVADAYVDKKRERIIEFSDPDTDGPVGGLIAFRRMDDGTLRIDLYRMDDTVKVTVQEGHLAPRTH